MSIEAYEKVQLDKHISLDNEYMNEKNKILIISQNSTDIFLVNKLLNQLGGFKVYEAANLNAALKVVSYLELDLIIVDDALPNIGGYEIIKRLNRNHILKNVPKVMLLTQDYKAKHYDDATLDNLDFIKKPIDSMIFKTRIHSILKNQQDKFKSGSLFENMIDAKISGAKEFLKVYKSFLDMDQNLLFIYDKDKNQIVEYNKNFTKFFGEYSLFNRIISDSRLMNLFVPKISDPNYLNAHNIDTWIDLITSAKDFNFIITLKKEKKEYSFNVQANKMKLFGKNMYIIKLSNYDLYLPHTKRVKSKENKKANNYLGQLQNLLNDLSVEDKRDEIKNNISNLLNELDIKSQYFNLEPSKEISEINIYFVIAKILKARINSVKARLNSKDVTENFEEDGEIIYANIQTDVIEDIFKGILNSYHDVKNLKVDVKLYKFKNSLKIEVITKSPEKVNSVDTFVSKLFKAYGTQEENDKLYNTTPKQLKNSLNSLDADIKTYFGDGGNIFIVSIPI